IGVLKKLAASGKIASDETVVAFITGSGYKTIEAVAGRTAVLHDIPPALEAFRSLHQRVKGARSVPGTPPLESVGA
ncbi:MAG TPA: hypothetical protein PLN89_07670, partial [Elusimicrobiota bacterium]|nr:hypothetical protein [Elusimicrobiota bacterium]